MRVSSGPRSRLPQSFRSVSRLLVAAAFPFAACALVPSLAYGQDASAQDIAQARQLGGQAQAAYDAGNFAESEKLWTAAGKLYSAAPTLTLGLARTQAKLGKYVAAQESYNRIVREFGNNPNPSPAFKDAIEAAKAEVGAMSAKLASVTIAVEGGAPNPQVTIDGQVVPAVALGLKRPVDPGQHLVKASAEGYKPAETSFTVAEGANAEAKVKLEKLEGAAALAATPATGTTPASSTSPAAADTGSKGSSNKTLALVAFGVGGAGLVVGAITGAIALGKHSDLETACPDGKCASSQQDSVDSYKTMGTISTIGFIVAGVGGVTGAVLWFTAPKEGSASSSARYKTVPASGVSVQPYLGLGAAGVTGRF